MATETRTVWFEGEMVEWTADFGPMDNIAPLPDPRTRVTAMWRARTIMKLTPWGEGTLFDAVIAAIAQLTDPVTRVTAEEALARGDVFDRDGSFVPMLAAVVGLSDEQMDDLIVQANALPA